MLSILIAHYKYIINSVHVFPHHEEKPSQGEHTMSANIYCYNVIHSNRDNNNIIVIYLTNAITFIHLNTFRGLVDTIYSKYAINCLHYLNTFQLRYCLNINPNLPKYVGMALCAM